MKCCKSWTNSGFLFFNISLMIRQLSQRDSSILNDPGEPLCQEKEMSDGKTTKCLQRCAKTIWIAGAYQ
jgi:hypothetical protein